VRDVLRRHWRGENGMSQLEKDKKGGERVSSLKWRKYERNGEWMREVEKE